MIPGSSDLTISYENSEDHRILPSRTYKLDTENKRIMGKVDGRDAVMQFIQKVLSTDKYAFEIYDWYYGNELLELVGQTFEYAKTRIPNIFKEALMTDDRILDVRDFTFANSSIDSMMVSCFVDTIYGEIVYEQEVLI